jgi:hypothetical protein
VSVAEVREVERREGSALELCRASCEWVVDGQRALLGRGSYSQVPWKWRGGGACGSAGWGEESRIRTGSGERRGGKRGGRRGEGEARESCSAEWR